MSDSRKARWFQTPESASGLAYATRFYMKVFQSLKQSESLDLGARLPPLKTHWFLSDATVRRWQSLFHYHAGLPQAFTYSAPAGVWALMQVLEDLGIKFSRIMHLNTRLQLLSGRGFEIGAHYTTSVHYQGARPLKAHSVVLTFRSDVRDVTGQDIMQVQDELYVRGLPEAFVRELPVSPGPVRARDNGELARNPLADHLPLRISRRLGGQYGRLSGDLNPLHISSLGARLLGHQGSFVQGLCTANLVLATLGNHWRQSIRSLDIGFERPVPQPAQLELICTLDRFVLVDRQGRSLASGCYDCG